MLQEELSLKFRNKHVRKVSLDCLREPRLISGSKAGMTEKICLGQIGFRCKALLFTLFLIAAGQQSSAFVHKQLLERTSPAEKSLQRVAKYKNEYLKKIKTIYKRRKTV
ncbi:hypothetical protein KAU11_04825, partial [Candidatus Babeliales bacterium]|nr:hypothetical protein [Candidatus Babeliales bacterium]